jgi:hypothetical protein
VSNVNAITLVIISWVSFTKSTGLSPLAAGQWKAYLLTYAALYAVVGNGLRPIRFGQLQSDGAGQQRGGQNEDHQQDQHHVDQRGDVDVADGRIGARAIESAEGHGQSASESNANTSWAKPSSSTSMRPIWRPITL